jgi:hypothetical protein
MSTDIALLLFFQILDVKVWSYHVLYQFSASHKEVWSFRSCLIGTLTLAYVSTLSSGTENCREDTFLTRISWVDYGIISHFTGYRDTYLWERVDPFIYSPSYLSQNYCRNLRELHETFNTNICNIYSLKMQPFSLFHTVVSTLHMFRLHIAIFRCGSVDYCTAIVLKLNV